MTQAELERFEAKLERVTESGCWIWLGYLNPKGYGRFRVSSKRFMQYAHRVSYEHFRAPIPPDMVMDHLCRVPSCVNPDHLEAVTPRENTMRSPVAVCAVRSRSALCQRGHALVPWAPNTYFGRRGYRKCPVCIRNRANAKTRSRTPEERERTNEYRRGWEAKRKAQAAEGAASGRR